MIEPLDNDELDPQIPSVLAIDVGNTNVRFACVSGEEVDDVHRIPAADLSTLSEELAAAWAQAPQPRKIVISSVNPPVLKVIEDALAVMGEEAVVIGRDLPLPIETKLANPEKVGVDRLCAAVAAFDRLGSACVVAQFGTAVTVDCVNDEGVFLGGAIMPGLSMGAASLAGGTAQLPKVELVNPDWVFGTDTRQAIVGGLVFGCRGALKGFVEAYATELGHWPLVIATGGDADLIVGDITASELVQAIVPDLVIRGVAMAYYRSLLR